MTPCSPISRRSQCRMSPSNSPSMRSVPLTISVPRKFAPTPITVCAGGGDSGLAGRDRNFIIGLPSLVSEALLGLRAACGTLPAFESRCRSRVVGVMRSLFFHDGSRSKNAPCFQKPLEVGLSVIFELDLTALARGRDRYPRGEALLELGLPFLESLERLRPQS